MADSEATSLVSPLPARMETEGDRSEKVKVDNMDYSVVLEEGQERFACDHCKFKADKSGGMKRHITTKHGTSRSTGQGRKRKSKESKKVESNSKEVKMDKEMSELVMEDLGVEFTSTQEGLEEIMAALEGGEEEEIEDDNEGRKQIGIFYT